MTALSEDDLDRIAPPVARSATRPFYWSVRRELWENRWVYLAPATVAGLVLLAFLISMGNLPERRRLSLALGPAQQAHAVAQPYAILAAAMALTAAVVGVVYCLGALHGERRDRSILFWKSLPVSDLTTVAAKAFVPLVILPLIALVLAVVLQGIVLAVGALVLAANGVPALPPAAGVSLPEMAAVLAYGLVVAALWWAPLYAWMLLVSGWAKRVPVLWAVVPPLALCLGERIAFGSAHLWTLLLARLAGVSAVAFTAEPRPVGDHLRAGMSLMRLSHLAPLRFLTSPDLWVGLLVAIALLTATIWQRRRREPI